uniref:Uncharacterized protein n=1 Tax=Rhizophora mucronata TaxID=61149 RepID=A0A2P2NF19_RHIMU
MFSPRQFLLDVLFPPPQQATVVAHLGIRLIFPFFTFFFFYLRKFVWHCSYNLQMDKVSFK